jgi:hypothetical protein
MTKHDRQNPPETSARPSRRDRLQALLFSAGALGTAIAALGLLGDVKLPRAQGE